MDSELSRFRRLVLRRSQDGQVALHDAETGEMLESQAHVELIQEPFEVTKVVVTFLAAGNGGITLDLNDGNADEF
ncbi:hypothetical protein SAMN05443545_101285 [Aidingimonas halophila]|uniref:Uncharacterized protein n=2 Tax=Aidingimonas halophila TaxID=574349 RepID=A0A1H2RCP7_9GAMM|nr:hypothetical protein SAMN05443545_101285 [Aidingimonas halophila]